MYKSNSDEFYELIQNERESTKVNCVSMVKLKYDQLIEKVQNLKVKLHKDGNESKFLKRYDINDVNGSIKLVSPATKKNTIKYFIADEDLYQILNDAHIATNHGGRDRMVKHLRTIYKNITHKDILIFLSLCESCRLQKQKSNEKKSTVAKPLVIKEIKQKCQIDLIDCQTQPDNGYHFILVYQDNNTKFLVLRPLKTNTAAEVCEHIIDIFSLLGVPSVLQSDNEPELVNEIMNKLVTIWPNLTIVHGKSEDSESEDVESMLCSWMQYYSTYHWSYGLKFIQLMKNSSLNSDIKKTPYEAMFGCPIQSKCNASNVPKNPLKYGESEQLLATFIKKISINKKNQKYKNHLEAEQWLNNIKREEQMKQENNDNVENKTFDITSLSNQSNQMNCSSDNESSSIGKESNNVINPNDDVEDSKSNVITHKINESNYKNAMSNAWDSKEGKEIYHCHHPGCVKRFTTSCSLFRHQKKIHKMSVLVPTHEQHTFLENFMKENQQKNSSENKLFWKNIAILLTKLGPPQTAKAWRDYWHHYVSKQKLLTSKTVDTIDKCPSESLADAMLEKYTVHSHSQSNDISNLSIKMEDSSRSCSPQTLPQAMNVENNSEMTEIKSEKDEKLSLQNLTEI